MVAVLDQFEIESLGSYQSGSYDQVVMGSMYSFKKVDGQKVVVFGNRGVAYGYADNDIQPGTTVFDLSNAVSYRSQPFSEKSGASRTAKITCQEERIYDSMPPNAWNCFKINGANVFTCPDFSESPGFPLTPPSNLEFRDVGFIMFDNYVRNGSSSRTNLNVGVDRHWTKAFPFAPQYSNLPRQSSLKFLRDGAAATYTLRMYSDNFPIPNAIGTPPRKVKGVYLGIVGPEAIGQYFNAPQAEISNGSNWKHYWSCDVFDTFNFLGFSTLGDLTSSMGNEDMAKVIYGFGDVNTLFTSSSYGADMLGTHNWPEFRKKFDTNPQPNPAVPSHVTTYEYVTSSMWCISPVIRGWKYGLYSGLPSYTAAHFRRGRYGQFRDMLEQRLFTKFFRLPNKRDKSPDLIIENSMVSDGPITVKFVDSKGNKTKPENTQSQNLSYEATSSLPYFDGQQRNRSPDSFNTTNLEMIIFGQNPLGEVTI